MCRTANGLDGNFTKEDYLKNIKSVINSGSIPKGEITSGAQKDGRGNICPVTVILPTLAMEAKKKSEKRGTMEYIVDEFMSILEAAIEDAKDSLIERYKWICAQNPKSASFMYENKTMFGYHKEEGIQSALKHGTLAIGQIGVSQALQILIGENHTTEKGMELAKRIEKLFSDKCAEYKRNYHLNFGVYLTPAENLAFTSMKKFQKKYGVIPNVSDKEYFTNSIHVPVWEQIDPFQKIDVESQLTGYSSAGCITYVELEDSAKDNLPALQQIVNYAMEKDIPYFALNLRLSHCCECDYDGDIDSECPVCGAKDLDDSGNPTGSIEKLARVTGYLSSDYRHFNKGKQCEVNDRFKHTKKLDKWVR